MKETEEETLLRVYDIVSQKWYHCPYNELTVHAQRDITVPIAKLYSSERLAQSLPTKEEIDKLAFDFYMSGFYNASRDSYKKGFKDAIELLTKGE